MSTQKHISAIKLTLAELLGMSTRAEWDVPYRRGLQEPERPQESPLPYDESLAKPVCIVGTTFVVALVGRWKFAPMGLSILSPSLPCRQRRRENRKDGCLLGYTLAYTSGTL